ncbi:MAG: NUDIX domain-containing protein [Clostridia bacterium]
MITKTIYGFNRHEKPERTRTAARAIIIEGTNILLTKFASSDMYMLPGGGIEDGESIEECCVREVLEETGYLCEVGRSNVIVEEYYEEMHYIHQYFICNIIGKGEINLTEQEKECDLKVEWMDIHEAYKMFSEYKKHSDFWEKEGMYLREYTGLKYTFEK